MRKYSTPDIFVIHIDNSVSLVLMSSELGNGNGQGGGWGPGGKPKGAAQANDVQLSSTPFETNPFQ